VRALRAVALSGALLASGCAGLARTGAPPRGAPSGRAGWLVYTLNELRVQAPAAWTADGDGRRLALAAPDGRARLEVTVPAAAFAALDDPIPSDVIVVADHDGARRTVMDLAVSIPGMRAFDGGTLRNSIGLEAFAALLLSLNVRHRGKASVRLEGVDGYRPEANA